MDARDEACLIETGHRQLAVEASPRHGAEHEHFEEPKRKKEQLTGEGLPEDLRITTNFDSCTKELRERMDHCTKDTQNASVISSVHRKGGQG